MTAKTAGTSHMLWAHSTVCVSSTRSYRNQERRAFTEPRGGLQGSRQDCKETGHQCISTIKNINNNNYNNNWTKILDSHTSPYSKGVLRHSIHRSTMSTISASSCQSLLAEMTTRAPHHQVKVRIHHPKSKKIIILYYFVYWLITRDTV